MKRSITSVIIILMAACAFAQDLYIGSFYVTTTDEEKLYGDGKNRWTTRKSHICNMFKYEMPDVLGLQSATESQLTSIKTGMNSGMTGLASYNLAGGILLSCKTLPCCVCYIPYVTVGCLADVPRLHDLVANTEPVSGDGCLLLVGRRRIDNIVENIVEVARAGFAASAHGAKNLYGIQLPQLS